MIRKDKNIILDIENPNNVLPFHLLQGNADLNLLITLTRCGVSEVVSPSAKITLICIYGLDSYLDKATNKIIETNQGNYVLAPGDTDYNITVLNNVITVPLTEMITNTHGKNQLILHVEDGISAYTYNLICYCDENLAYKAKSTPNNLPTYEALAKEVADLKTQSDSLANDMASVKDDVNDLANDMPNKANSDLSNVDIINNLPNGNLLYKQDGTLKDTGISIDQGAKVVDFPYSIKTLPNTLLLGDNIKIHENGGFVENTVVASGRNYLMLDYLNDPIKGTSVPVYWERGPLITQVEVQADASKIMNDVKIVNYGNPLDDHETSAFYLKAVNPVNNFKMKVNINGKDVAYYPSKLAWLGQEPGINLVANLNKIPIEPHFSSLVDYNIKFEFKADGPINLLGNGQLPYMAIDENKIARYDVALKKDISSELTPEEIRNKLSTLVGDNRLDAAHIKNIPTSNGVNEFAELTDTPATYSGMKNKLLVVKADESGIEFTDMPNGVDYSNLNFAKSFGIEVINKSGAAIPANSFVFIEPITNSVYSANLITRTTGYNGELIGLCKNEIAINAKGNVDLIANIQTSIATVSVGEAAYIGFLNSGDDSIGINKKTAIDTIFGECGVFGAKNSIGESTVIFNAFSLIAFYFAQKHGTIPDLSNYLTLDLADVVLDKLYEKGIAAKLIDSIRIGQTHGDYRIGNVKEIEVHNGLDLTFDTPNESVALSLDPGLSNLPPKVTALEDEVNRLKTDISTGGLETYVWRDRGIPVIPTDKQYKAYYIHSLVLRDSNGVINLPSNAPDGAILSIENNDRNDYVSLRPAQGQTINGNSGSYQCGHDTLNYFVKDANDWVLAYGGVFPNSYDSLKSTIQALFPNQLHTLDEVEAQLKDRLHTFREIQSEFSNQLHTNDAIEAEMINRGFSKGFSVGYGMLTSSIPSQDLSWVQAHIAPNAEVVIPASNEGMKYLAIYMPVYLSALVSEIKINQQSADTTESSIVANELDYAVFVANNQIDTSISNRLSIEFHNQQSVGAGITVDDGSNNVASVKTLNVKNMQITKSDIPGEIDLTSNLNFFDGMLNQNFLASKIQSLDKSIRISNLNGVADLSLGKNGFNSGIHTALGSSEFVNSKYTKSKLYFSDVKVKGDSFVYFDQNKKSYILQDIDPQDDPNVSGGTTFLIGLYFEPDFNSDNDLSQDGNIQLELVDLNDSPIIDVNGNPMGVQIDYKAGDKVKPELYVGECQIKNFTEAHLKISLNFANEEIISVGANTQLCIQAINKKETSGLALLSFMAFTGYQIQYYVKYYGYNSLNMAQYLIFDQAETDTGVDTWDLGDNTYLDFKSNCKASISSNHLIIKDDGNNIPVWSLSKLYTPLDAKFISGKNLKATATLVDKDDAFRVALLQYTGSDLIPPKPVVLSYNNENPIFTLGWVIVDSMFITEDAVSGDHVQSKTFTVPTNSKGFAICMYAVGSQIPMTLKLKDLEVDITPWFNKVVVIDSSHIKEKYLIEHDYIYRSVVATPSGMVGYRYTANNLDTKIPFGVVSGTGKNIANDNAWSDLGSSDPNKTQGDMKFLANGTVKLTYTARCFNEQNTLNQIQFWIAKVNGDGTFTEVANSKVATTIEANRVSPKFVSSPQIVFEVSKNDSYRFFMKSDKKDGFYIESNTDGRALFRTDIEFDEITAEEQLVLDKLTLLDGEIVITKEALDAGWYIELDYDPSTQKPSLSPKQKAVNP